MHVSHICVFKSRFVYASVSLFAKVSTDLQYWLEPNDDDGNLLEDEQNKRVEAFFRLTDYDKVYQFAGNAIVDFISKKPNPFPSATDSKEQFAPQDPIVETGDGLHKFGEIHNKESFTENLYSNVSSRST